MRDVTSISGDEIVAERASRSRSCPHCSGSEALLPPIDLANRLALRPTEAARVLGVSERTIRTMLPDLPHFRYGNVVLIPVEELRRWAVERSRITGDRIESAVREILSKASADDE